MPSAPVAVKRRAAATHSVPPHPARQAWTRLLELGDTGLAHRELGLDACYSSLSPAMRSEYVDRSLGIGHVAALDFRGHSAEQAARRLRIVVIECDDMAEPGPVLRRSAYDSAAATIFISLASVAQARDLLREAEACGVLPPGRSSTARDLHLAHELFHHLEATTLRRVDELLPRAPGPRLGPIHLPGRRVARCREIAAHAFAKELVGLPFLPNALDLAAIDTGCCAGAVDRPGFR